LKQKEGMRGLAPEKGLYWFVGWGVLLSSCCVDTGKRARPVKDKKMRVCAYFRVSGHERPCSIFFLEASARVILVLSANLIMSVVFLKATLNATINVATNRTFLFQA
jgi:hypothetical protein